MDAGGLPPPPPVPEGAVPTKAPGYGGGNGSTLSGGPSHSGPNGGGTGTGRNGGHNGTGPNGESGSTGLAALALLSKVPIPSKEARPDYGRLGRPVQLCVNYFRARLVKAEDVYHYNVRLTLTFSLPSLLCCLALYVLS